MAPPIPLNMTAIPATLIGLLLSFPTLAVGELPSVERAPWIVPSALADGHLRLDAIPELGIELVTTSRATMPGGWRPQETSPSGLDALEGDPYRAEQYALDHIDIPTAWLSTRGDGVLIAVLDSGIDVAHPDLPRAHIREPAVNDSSWWTDACGHGTAVTGVILAAPANGVGIAGAAPGAEVMPVKVLRDDCHGDTFQLAKGIVTAALSGADVISISVNAGAPGAPEPPELQAAIAFADARGSLVVVAAGNRAAASVSPPANDALALAVACTDRARARCGISSYGSYVGVSAPGEEIITTRSGGDYGSYTGTSMSAPHVAAVAALALSHHGPMCPGDLRTLLRASATPLIEEGMGGGMVNASRAISHEFKRTCPVSEAS